MLQRLVRRSAGAPVALARAALSGAAAPCACASVQELLPAAPGTVTPYSHHVFIRCAPPEDLAPPETSGRDGLAWWPAVVEKLPVLVRAFMSVARQRAHIDGTVKVTAYDALAGAAPRLGSQECDLMVFPDGVEYRGLPVVAVSDVVAAHVTEPTEDDLEFQPPPLPPGAEQLAAAVEGLCLFVCCHGSRDARCGALGEPLAARLAAAARELGLSEAAVRVLRCSHIGGHKYAGNVCVYGPASPCDGDWYGGLRARDAPAFLAALLDARIDSAGGPAEPLLARHWRGRLGLTKDEQVRLAAGERLDDATSEDELDEAEGDVTDGEDLPEHRVRVAGGGADGAPPSRRRRGFARLLDGCGGDDDRGGDGEDDQESSSDCDDDWDSDEPGGSESSDDSSSDDVDAGPPLR